MISSQFEFRIINKTFYVPIKSSADYNYHWQFFTFDIVRVIIYYINWWNTIVRCLLSLSYLPTPESAKSKSPLDFLSQSEAANLCHHLPLSVANNTLLAHIVFIFYDLIIYLRDCNNFYTRPLLINKTAFETPADHHAAYYACLWIMLMLENTNNTPFSLMWHFYF